MNTTTSSRPTTEENELDSLNREELFELHKLNSETIDILEKDVELYKWQIKQLEPFSISEWSKGSLSQNDPSFFHAMQAKSKVEQEITKLEGRIKDTEVITGINVDKVLRNVHEIEGGDCKMNYTVSLRILNKEVRLNYDVHEHFQKIAKNQIDAESIIEYDAQCTQEISDVIGDAVKEASEDLDMQSMISLLKTYISCLSERERVIQHCVEKYPNDVSHVVQGKSHILKIAHHKENRPTFLITWGVDLSPMSRFQHDVVLKVQASKKLKRLDEEGILENAPNMFASMTEEMGLDEAVDTLIQMVSTDGKAA